MKASHKKEDTKSNYTKDKLKRIKLHLKPVILSIIISICISAVLLYAIYKILPEESWISLELKPDHYVINDFTGKIYSEFTGLSINQGELINDDNIILTIGEEEYELERSELRIVFNRFKDADKYNVIPYANHSTFSPHQANIYVTLDSEPSIQNSLIEIKKSSNIYKSVLGGDLEDLDRYSVYFTSGLDSQLHMSVLNKTSIKNTGGFDLYIKDEKVSIGPLSTIKVRSKDESISNVNFQLRTNDFKIYLNEKDILYSEGLVYEFNGKSDEGILNHSYLGEQNDYELKNIDTYGKYLDESLNFQLELSENKHMMNINGFVNELEIANTSLYFKFTVFIAKNIDNIILAVFTAFIATYIPFILNRKEE